MSEKIVEITSVSGGLAVGDFVTFDDFWTDCPVDGCENKICLALYSDKCFVHTPGWAWTKRRRIEIIRLCRQIIEWCEA